MTRTRLTLLAVASVAALYGLLSVAGAIFVAEVAPFFRGASFAIGSLLVLGAALLMCKPRWGVALLWVSAATYAAVMLLPAFYRHGIEAFSALMGAFYYSLAMRLMLAAIAHLLVARLIAKHSLPPRLAG